MLLKDYAEKRWKANPEPAWLTEARRKAWAFIEKNIEKINSGPVWRKSGAGEFDITKLNFEPGRWPALGELPQEATAGFPSGNGHAEDVAVFFDSSLVYSKKGTTVSDEIIQTLSKEPDELSKYLTAVSGEGDDPWETLNLALFDNGLFIKIPEGVKCEYPIYSLWWTASGKTANFPRIIITAGKRSELTFVEEVSSSDEQPPGLHCAVSEVFLEEGAKLNYIRLNRPGNAQINTSAFKALLGRESRLDFTALELTQGTANLSLKITLAGTGAQSRVSAATLGYGSGLVSYNTLQDHLSTDTVSNMLYKSVLYDQARSNFYGVINVGKEAARTDAYQISKSLLLSKEAKADSVPVLEIKTNDVRCSHGATTSSIDDEERFYLQSRGIPKGDADKLIVEGFLADVLDKIKEKGLRGRLTAILNGKLGAQK